VVEVSSPLGTARTKFGGSAELSPRGERNRALQGLTTATLLELFRARMVAAASEASTKGGEDAFERLAPVRRAREQLALAYATVRDLERNANAHLAWDKLLLQLGERGRA